MTVPSRLLPRGDSARARQCWLAIGLLAVACGCRQHGPVGRCGLPELCEPVVLEDPLPNDCCVPMKGVNPTHFGYTRPQWRVIGDRLAECCSPAMPLEHEAEQLEPPEAIQDSEAELPLGAADAQPRTTGPQDVKVRELFSDLRNDAPENFDLQEIIVAELPSESPTEL